MRKRTRAIIFFAICFFLLAALATLPFGSYRFDELIDGRKVETINMNDFSREPPPTPLRLLFIHHSCGGQLLAAAGADDGESCIYKTHENGGDLRALLEKDGYEVHEASYGSEVGELTDIFHWLPKFKEKMDKILTCDRQDDFYKDGRRNQIVAFKSCYPNNLFTGEGGTPGNPAGPELTVWNARAAYNALLDEFAKHTEILFVAVTAPPVANHFEPESLLKTLARKVRSRPRVPTGPFARSFNDWLRDSGGWLKDYPHKNVVVFDYYDILTDRGRTNYSAYPSKNGKDSHPSKEGNQKAAQAFVPFLNQAVRRAALVE